MKTKPEYSIKDWWTSEDDGHGLANRCKKIPWNSKTRIQNDNSKLGEIIRSQDCQNAEIKTADEYN
jgi:hypothetical protein